jgi:hypothetical protein
MPNSLRCSAEKHRRRA